jgi:hypothetical protein
MSLAMDKTGAEAALAACQAKGYHAAVAVVDRAGQVMVILRDEQASAQSAEMAPRKAYTGRMFRTTTLGFQKRTHDPGYAAQRDVADILAPEPKHAIRQIKSNCAMVYAHACGPEFVNLLEVERRMARVGFRRTNARLATACTATGGRGSKPKNSAPRDGSQLRGPARPRSRAKLAEQFVQLSTLHVGLKLPVPGLGIELDEPIAEGFQLLGRELLQLAFDVLHSAHSAVLSVTLRRGVVFRRGSP